MNVSPAITGETASGRSASAMSSVRPGTFPFAIAHAAVSPNTTFSGTAIAATIERQPQRVQQLGLAQRRRSTR